MSLIGLAAQHSQLALCPLMERRAPARRASECGIAARGIARTFGGGLGRSTVAHFARKVRGRILWRTSTENPTKSCPRALVMFATCSWPSLCEQSELQCFASDLRRMFAQRLLLLCRTCYANLQMMVGLALENNPKSGKSHKYRKIPQIIVNFVGKGTEGQWVSHWNLLR